MEVPCFKAVELVMLDSQVPYKLQYKNNSKSSRINNVCY